jgi:hypothetical protein
VRIAQQAQSEDAVNWWMSPEKTWKNIGGTPHGARIAPGQPGGMFYDESGKLDKLPMQFPVIPNDPREKMQVLRAYWAKMAPYWSYLAPQVQQQVALFMRNMVDRPLQRATNSYYQAHGMPTDYSQVQPYTPFMGQQQQQ